MWASSSFPRYYLNSTTLKTRIFTLINNVISTLVIADLFRSHLLTASVLFLSQDPVQDSLFNFYFLSFGFAWHVGS